MTSTYRAVATLCSVLAIGAIPASAAPQAGLAPVSSAPRDVNLPDDQMADDLARWLNEQKAQGLKDSVDLKLFAQLLPQLKGLKDLKDPDALRKWLQNNPQLADPEALQNLGNMLEKYAQKNPGDPQLRNLNPGRFNQQVRDLVENRRPGDGPVMDPKGPFEGPPKMVPTTPEPPHPSQPETENRAKEMTSWFQRHFGESKAVNDLVRDLSTMVGDGRAPGSDRPFSFLPDWKADGDAFGNWASRNMSFLKDVKLPDLKLGGVKMPSFGSGGGPPALGGSGSMGAGGTGGGSWAGLIIVVLLGAGGLALWIVLVQKRGDAAGKRAESGTRDWPVDLALIASREELVRAFDHLSLQTFGDDARVWNHRVIAGQMGGDAEPRREAVGTLAELYERARYAPETEAFTDEQFAEARRQFRVLGAGGLA